MNVVLLTNHEHFNFVGEFVSQYHDHLIFVINNKSDFEKFIDNYSYDVGISFMYQHKVPAREVNTHTWFNFHPAPLPEYKGRNLCYHAIMNGDKEFGATLHYMDENFDTGNIIKVDWFKILPSDTAEDVSRQAVQMSKTQFKRYFPRILAGEVFPSSPNVGGNYYPKEPIPDTMDFHQSLFPVFVFERFIRAVTYKNFYPKIVIGGVTYKIVKEE